MKHPLHCLGSAWPSAAALLLCSLSVAAQVSSKTQDFSGSAATPSTYVTLTTSANATNSGTAGYFSTSFTQPGTGAFGVADNNASTTPNTIPVVFSRETFQAGSANNKVTFQLGQKGNFGFDDNNNVTVSISINGGAAVNALTIDGPNSNSAPVFNIGTGGSYTSTYGTPATYSFTMLAATGANPSLNAVGNYTINLPAFSSRTTVDVTISVRAARKSTVLIDNVTISSSLPLPVELTRFEALASTQAMNLSWATASEKNSDRFEVQRSATGEAYQTIGMVKGQGSSTSAHTYSFVDSRPFTGRAYYRLRQVDTDGTVTFSPVVATQALAGIAAAYPNPSLGLVTLPSALSFVQYRIFNTIGQMLLTGKAAGNDRIDITSLPKGPFFLELASKTGCTTQRLVHE
ncbi:T9SS type A sorting domain-containing protein [Hymenobacter negativus]|uniref:T9SS type A sorting domain-containing protein n=1 Tax=Hymenobacter negativus TaxID=2795026 RepID=A0ABS3QHX4_9BACT|nr:T9SS type A sorting domain-containing protein [Hymenobacter negativus]MBO2010762.1 T9SS type A sorting domain-containing protein [Hymenobacter negativus]